MTPEEAADKIIRDNSWYKTDFGFTFQIDFTVLEGVVRTVVQQAIDKERDACLQHVDKLSLSSEGRLTMEAPTSPLPGHAGGLWRGWDSASWGYG